MSYVVGETIFAHKKYGRGLLVKLADGRFVVEFEEVGVKTFSENAIFQGYLKEVSDLQHKKKQGTDMGDYIQYDTSKVVMGGANIVEAVTADKKLVFSESYTVMGKRLKAPAIYANYDFTVSGDLEVDEIEVRGNLTVLGDIKVGKLNCDQDILCVGNISAKYISSSNIMANDIMCKNVSCTGNILVKTSIDIGMSAEIGKTVIAGEGITGGGIFSAQTAVACDFVSFNGDMNGNIVEVDDTGFSRLSDINSDNKRPDKNDDFAGIIEVLDNSLHSELENIGSIDEDEILGFLEKVSEYDNVRACDWHMLMKRMIDISHYESIYDYIDYLYAVMARKIFPDEVTGYETIEHVFTNLLPKAEKDVEGLPFHASSIDELIYALQILDYCGDEIGIEKDEGFEKVFQSVGIKYKTVKGFLDKNKR